MIPSLFLDREKWTEGPRTPLADCRAHESTVNDYCKHIYAHFLIALLHLYFKIILLLQNLEKRSLVYQLLHELGLVWFRQDVSEVQRNL